MNVVLLVPEYLPDPGGVAKSAARIAQGLAEGGSEVTVVTTVSSPDAMPGLEVEELRPSERLVVLRFPRGSFDPDHWGRELGELVERLKDRSPNVLHAMGSLRFGQIASVLGRRFGIPAVYGLRGSDANVVGLQNPGRFATVMRGASAVTAVSRHLAERAMTLGARAVEVIPNTVPRVAPRSRERARKAIGLPADVPWIGACSSRRWIKGPERLTNLLKHVSRRWAGPLALCSFGADDGGAAGVAWSSSGDGSSRPFRHLGEVDALRVLDAVSALDLLVMTSHDEGMPNLLLEALSVGTPVAATPAGGCKDVLSGSGAGLLLSWNEVDAAEEIVALLESGDLADMRARARRHVEDHFAPEREVTSLQALYRRVISAPSACGDGVRD